MPAAGFEGATTTADASSSYTVGLLAMGISLAAGSKKHQPAPDRPHVCLLRTCRHALARLLPTSRL